MKKVHVLASQVKLFIEQTTKYPDIAQVLAAYNYDEQEMQKGNDLLVEMLLRQVAQQKEYGEQLEATDDLDKAKDDAWDLYMKHTKIARAALKDNRGAMKLLSLNGARERKGLVWLEQARIFYVNADQMSAVLHKVGINKSEIERANVMIQAVQEAVSKRKKEMDEACLSTQDKYEAVADMEAWMSDLKSIARIAFKNQPDKLRTLGIKPVQKRK